MRAIDLNSDLGEGMTNDGEVMAWITSANVACGAHAGDPALMARTVAMAKQRAVAVGAHPAYPDRERFGRVAIEMPEESLRASLLDQLALLADVAAKLGVRLGHVKAHGALYNRGERDLGIARLICATVLSFDRELVLFCPPGSPLAEVAAGQGLRVAREGFCDRAYEPDGTLRPRSKPGALITDPEEAAAQALALAGRGDVDTLCVHGDTPGAPAIARRVRKVLQDAGYEVRPFA